MKYFLLLCLVLACGRSGQSGDHAVDKGSVRTPEDTSLDAVTNEYNKLLNEFRRENGLERVEHSQVIAGSSQGHSKNMASKFIPFGHLGSSGRCSFIKKTLGDGNLCGEIVAFGQRNALEAFNAWKNSPGHRSIMVNPRYTHAGLGYFKDPNGRIYWTQIFLELK